MQGIVSRIIILSAVLGFSVSTLAADLPRTTPARAGFSAQRLQVLDTAMQAEIDAGRKAGIVVLVARNGKVLHQNAYGYADLASKQPMTLDTHVRLYSMTKVVTSVALLTLYEQGKFLLNDPLEKYIPQMAGLMVYAGADEQGQAILEAPLRKPTIHDVFRHTAGFAYSAVGTPAQVAQLAPQMGYGASSSLQHLVAEQLAALPLLYQPGERWEYSFSHDVQAYLVEIFSGMPFADYVQQTILDPLKMHNSHFGVPDSIVERYAANYRTGEDGALELVERQDGTKPDGAADNYQRYGDVPFGGSGLSSTIMDYARFAQMLVNGGELEGVRILGGKTVELMRSNHLPDNIPAINNPGAGYGLGVQVLLDTAEYGNLGSVGMFGWAGAATTWVWMDPKENLVSILFTQYMPTDFDLASKWQTLVYQAMEK